MDATGRAPCQRKPTTVVLLSTQQRQQALAIFQEIQMNKENIFINLLFVVAGEDIAMNHLNIHETLDAVRNQALAQSGNTSRPPKDWEIRTEQGVLLPPSSTLESLGFVPGTKPPKLFLSLAVGAGG
jgi:Protein of Unknown function (DUF2604)